MSVAIGVAIAGALGSLARYGLDRAIEQRAEGAFPWSTFVINVTGCVLVGFLIAALVDRGNAPEWLRAARRQAPRRRVAPPLRQPRARRLLCRRQP